MEQSLESAFGEVADGALGNAILEVGIDAAEGMVQAWVGQKRLKCDILRLFLMSKVELWTLFQQIQTQYNNHSTICYSYY